MKDTVLDVNFRVLLLKVGYTESDMRMLFLDMVVKNARV